jgi:hypothetical protein
LSRELRIRHKPIDLKVPGANLEVFFDECTRDLDAGQTLLITIDEFHRLFPWAHGHVDTANADMSLPFRFSALNYDHGRPVVCMFITSQFGSEEDLRTTLRQIHPSGDEFERRTRGSAELPPSSLGDKFIVAAATAWNHCFSRVRADALLALTLHREVQSVSDVAEIIKGTRRRRYLGTELARGDLSAYSPVQFEREIEELLRRYRFGLGLESSLPPEDENCAPRNCEQYLRGG